MMPGSSAESSDGASEIGASRAALARRIIADRAFALAGRHPRIALLVADIYGRMSYQFRGTLPGEARTTRDELKRLFPDISRRRAHRIRVAQAGSGWRHLLLARLMRAGYSDALLPLARWKDAEHLLTPLDQGIPVIASCWHIGPTAGTRFGFILLDRPTTVVARHTSGVRRASDWEGVGTDPPRGSHVLAYTRSAARLKTGGLVVMACDLPTIRADAPVVSFLGSPMKLKRGFASLSFRYGARIIPVAVRWTRSGGLLYQAFPPLEATLGPREDRMAYEAAVIQEFAVRLESYFRQRPGDLMPGILGKYLRSQKRLSRFERRAAEAGGMPGGDDGSPAAEWDEREPTE
jgi:lauroyl/myristoyl acyltransferase